jgi:hypothetical protein
MLLQPPLASYRPLAQEIEGKPACAVSHGHPPVGFLFMDAPSQTAGGPRGPPAGHQAISGHVLQLQRDINAWAPLGPPLHSVVREKLQAQQISPEAISSFLLTCGSLNRYDSAWRKFWGFLKVKDLSLDLMSTAEVAAAVLEVSNVFPAQGRYIYSALLQLPSLGGIRFSPLLSKLKRQWNQSIPRYVAFWDPKPVLDSFFYRNVDVTTQ